MAAPVIQQSGTNYTATGTTNECPAPANVAVGDLLVGVYSVGTTSTLSGPTGWTELFYDTDAAVTSHGVWWKIANSSDAAASTFDFTSSGNARTCAVVLRIDGHDATTPIGTQFAGNSYPSQTASPVSPTVTTTVDDSLVILTQGGDQNRADTHPSSTNLIANDNNGTDVHQGVAWTTQATAGATGTNTWTLSAADDCYAYTVVVRPSASGAKTVSVAVVSASAVTIAPTKIAGPKTVSVAITSVSSVTIAASTGGQKTVAVAMASASVVAITPTRIAGSVEIQAAIAAASAVSIVAIATRIAQAAINAVSSLSVVPSKSGTQAVSVAISSITGVSIVPTSVTVGWREVSATSSVWTDAPPTSSTWSDI